MRLDLYGRAPVTLVRRPGNRWYEGDAEDDAERTDLAGCVDVDIALTPLTNTLPIRRIGLEPGESADLRVVYIQVDDDLRLDPSDQRYTRLGTA